MASEFLIAVFLIFCLFVNKTASITNNKFDSINLLVVTVATDAKNEGLMRLSDSAKQFGLKLQVFGTEEQWRGGDLKNNAVLNFYYHLNF